MSAGGGPRMHAALPALLLALWAASGVADDAADDAPGPGTGASVPAQASEAVVAQPEETAAAGSDHDEGDESEKAPASGHANASVSEADEAGQSAGGSLLSRIVEWLRGATRMEARMEARMERGRPGRGRSPVSRSPSLTSTRRSGT